MPKISEKVAFHLPTRGLVPPTRGLKYGFQGTINAKNLQKSRFSPFEGVLACFDGGYSPLALPLATSVVAQIRTGPFGTLSIWCCSMI